MDTFFENPKGLGKVIKAGLGNAREKEEIGEEELQKMLDAAMPPAPNASRSRRAQSFELRGEGGSGEKPRSYSSAALTTTPSDKKADPQAVQSPEGKSGFSFQEATEIKEEGQKGEDGDSEGYEEEGGEPSLHNYEEGGEEGDVSILPPSATSKTGHSEGGALASFRAYCEDQFYSMNALLQSVVDRVQELERATSPPANFATLYRGTGSPTPLSPPRHGRMRSSVSLPRAPPQILAVSREKIEEFLRANPRYPTLAVVRNAKLRLLQTQMGLPPKDMDVRVAEWDATNLYTLLTSLHYE